MPVDDRIPLILDTDIGTDIDDAVCLAYLLCQPRVDLLGITTVTAEPNKRAMLADMLCLAAGRNDIPIYSGSANPLLVPPMTTVAAQAEVLNSYANMREFEPFTAVDFMRRTIRSRPGEITLLCIGPLTNIGLLFAIDPEIPGMLKQLVMMCGVFETAPRLEYNAVVDPHAAAIVYGAPVSSHVSIGLDVTMRCQMNAEECRSKFKGTLLETVGRMAEVWFRDTTKTITFHDPLAAAVVFEPDICKYRNGEVQIELQSSRMLGMTHWNASCERKPHRIAVDVDVDKFFEHYFLVTK